MAIKIHKWINIYLESSAKVLAGVLTRVLNLGEVPPYPRPFTHSIMHAHLPDNRKSLTTYRKHLVECV